MFEDLQSLLDTHRKQAFLTCDKHCFCWDVENFISCHEQAGGTTTLAPDSGESVARGISTQAYSFAKLFAGENPHCG